MCDMRQIRQLNLHPTISPICIGNAPRMLKV